MPEKVLLTGSNGLLGQKLQELFAQHTAEFTLFCTSRGPNRQPEGAYSYYDIDLTNPEEVMELCDTVEPRVIINAAAMTNVDACESDAEGAWNINVGAVHSLIEAATRHKSHIIQLSTDFVFDGESGPYLETDDVNPLSVYGKTKEEAEGDLLRSGLRNTVLRTVLVYGHAKALGRSNIALWIAESISKGLPVRLVRDQFRTPTLAEDLAQAVLLSCQHHPNGIYHIASDENVSIVELGQLIMEEFGLGSKIAEIVEISTAELAQPAPRPLKGGLVNTKAKEELGFQPTPLREGLRLLRTQLEREGLLPQ